jgi:hypothetical protein
MNGRETRNRMKLLDLKKKWFLEKPTAFLIGKG